MKQRYLINGEILIKLTYKGKTYIEKFQNQKELNNFLKNIENN